MTRFLFVVPPLAGHLNPTVPVGLELQARGHHVAWTGHAQGAGDRLPRGARFLPLAERLSDELQDVVDRNMREPRVGLDMVRTIWEHYVVPLAREMRPGAEAVVDEYRPDVLWIDELCFAGVAVAEIRRLPWATSAATVSELVTHHDQLGEVGAWMKQLLRDLMVELGVDPARADGFDPRFSPDLVVAFTLPEFVYPPYKMPDHYHLVGASIGERPDPVPSPFPWEWLDGNRPLVLISLGSINWERGGRFFRAAAEAVSALGWQGVVVAPPDLLPDPPSGVLVVRRVPLFELLPRLDVMVNHAGHTSVVEAFAFGIPQVVAPMNNDQPFVAGMVALARAGVRVSFDRATPADLRAALTAVHTDPRYRQGAARLRRSCQAGGGVGRAADLLEALARR